MLVQRVPITTCIFLSAAVLLSGCNSDAKQKRKTGSAKGTVTKIDLPNNNVSMKILHQKTGKEIEVAGTITADTEVWVNGVRKTPADVEVNDDIRVDYYREGDDLEQRFTVSRVDVTRSDAWKSTKPVVQSDATPRPLVTDPNAVIVQTPERGSRLSTPLSIPTTTSPADKASQEQAVTDVIYQEIRRRFTNAIAERAALLSAGKSASDPEVLNHESVIRKARSLLMERGENVEPVIPPLPEDSPATAPGH